MRSPFELRYDLLSLAHDHLETQFNANVKFAQVMIEAAIASGTSTAEAITKYMPKFPTTEDVVNGAKNFYSFVDTIK